MRYMPVPAKYAPHEEIQPVFTDREARNENLAALARQYGPKGIHRLAEIAGLKTEEDGRPSPHFAPSPQVRVCAIQELLNRGYGKVMDHVRVSSESERPIVLLQLTASQLEEAMKRLEDRI